MAGIKFPFLCKPLVAQGSNDAHKVYLNHHRRYKHHLKVNNIYVCFS